MSKEEEIEEMAGFAIAQVECDNCQELLGGPSPKTLAEWMYDMGWRLFDHVLWCDRCIRTRDAEKTPGDEFPD